MYDPEQNKALWSPTSADRKLGCDSDTHRCICSCKTQLTMQEERNSKARERNAEIAVKTQERNEKNAEIAVKQQEKNEKANEKTKKADEKWWKQQHEFWWNWGW